MPDDNKIQTPDYDPENPRCNQEQLKFLKDCIAEGPEGIKKWNQWYEDKHPEIWLQKADLSKANLQIANLWQAHLEGANLRRAHLEGASLREAHLEGADLEEAHLEGTGLTKAYLEGANLEGTHLEGAKLMEAHLEGTALRGNHLQGADFSRAIVDGKTLVWGCEVDCKTKVEAVGLDSMRIYPATKQLLEYNIRRMNWEEWYKEHPKLKWLVKPFWLMSNYGMSTGWIIFTFFILAIIFATIYFVFGAYDYYLLSINNQPGIVKDLFVPVAAENPMSDVYYGVIIYLRSIYFSVVTMTTLGFGDMFVNTASFGLRWWFGHLLLIAQVILGYILLGALVTRFAVLFTAGGPAGKFTPIHPKAKFLIKRIDDIRKAVIPRKDRKKTIQLWCKLSQEISDGKYKHSEE